MKVLLLESTPKDTEVLKELFETVYTETHSFEEVKTYEELKLAYNKEDFDLMIMNIDLDFNKALDLIKLYANDKIEIIITANNEDKMIEAYKHNIAGFLLKPIKKDAFISLSEKIDKRIAMCRQEKQEEYAHFKVLIESGKINRIVLTTLDGYVIVHYSDIIRCEANGNYTSVYFQDGSFLMLTKTLKHYASKLEDHGFFRVHKTHLVNLDCVRSFVKGKNSYVELTDGSQIEVSSRKKQTLVEILNN